jgi:hypothetical protein
MSRTSLHKVSAYEGNDEPLPFNPDQEPRLRLCKLVRQLYETGVTLMESARARDKMHGKAVLVDFINIMQQLANDYTAQGDTYASLLAQQHKASAHGHLGERHQQAAINQHILSELEIIPELRRDEDWEIVYTSAFFGRIVSDDTFAQATSTAQLEQVLAVSEQGSFPDFAGQARIVADRYMAEGRSQEAAQLLYRAIVSRFSKSGQRADALQRLIDIGG